MALEVLKAQEIGYPVVGQEIKYPSNVIDYNINQEHTKDSSSITNANNQTTTGLATVIPGINAPKLLEKTSIIGGGTGFCQLEIGHTGTIETGSFTYFNNLSVTDSCGSVTLDANKTDIKLASGIYIVFVFLHIHKSSATFTISGHYHYPNDEFDRLIAGSGEGGQFNMYCGICKSDGTGYIKIGINPTLNVSNFQNSFIRIARIG